MSLHNSEEASLSPDAETSIAYDAAPTIDEVVQLTRLELITAHEGDSIVGCGRAALSLLRAKPDLAAKLAYQKLHDVPYKEVKTCWRRLYTDAALWRVLQTLEGRVKQTLTHGSWIDEIVKLLDTTLILTAAPLREELVELWLTALENELSTSGLNETVPEPSKRPAKKLKFDHNNLTPLVFPDVDLESVMELRHPTPRCDGLSLSAFQRKLSSPTLHSPLIIEHAIQHWPALSDRPWSDPDYLLKRTLGGRRLVPIETGRSYTDSGWGQKITTFKDFMSTYMLNKDILSQGKLQTGYLAQHDLFAQIPTLRADISVPDFCYCDPAPNSLPNVKQTPKLEEPLLNAWFGPKGTISPLHTDPYHNILAQVVGYKYVRLYAPDQTERLYPRSVDENGVDMSNTSLVDLDQAIEVFPEIGVGAGGSLTPDSEQGEEREEKKDIQLRRQVFEKQFPGFATAKYIEGVLGPGECLYLPPGWWHYVKSLSPSFSVSFWFN
ncbi:Cupin domain-containing protein [Stagonosporopsis vannaccii]|nr:Cupin domain-containing protein [Stagonosporopsis vannaccii]